MHTAKKLFCKVRYNCNLVSEFNGLVSKRVGRKISPFYCLFHRFNSSPVTISFKHFSHLIQPIFNQWRK